MHSIKELEMLQGTNNKTLYKKKLSLHFYLLSFLLLSMILSGFFCGITSTSGKIFLDLVFLSDGINILIDPLLYIVLCLVIYSVFSNFYMLNTAISLFT
jgi:hypothetical protein